MKRRFRHSFQAFGICLLSAMTASGQESVTISLNFAADEPPDIGSEIESGEPAGVLGSTEWNNLDLNFGTQSGLIDSNGEASEVSVLWESNNTWASGKVETSPGVFEGRGEDNIEDSVPRAGDRDLMTGYLDSTEFDEFCAPDQSQLIGDWCGANRVTVGGLPFEGTYDVIVYLNGGVLGRSGAYQLNDRDPVFYQDTSPFNGEFDLSFEERQIGEELLTVFTGDVMIFSDVEGGSFVLNTRADDLFGTAAGFRSAINGIEITGTVDGVPVVPGDVDGDGKVDANDLNFIGLNWQQNVDPGTNGDLDGDGFVNAADLNILGTNWQFGVGAAPLNAAVPEPGTGALIFALLAIGPLARRCRKRSAQMAGCRACLNSGAE